MHYAIFAILILASSFVPDSLWGACALRRRSPLLGCREIRARVRQTAVLAAGMVTQVYLGEMDGTKPVVIKRFGKITVHNNSFEKPLRRAKFLNRINFARLGIRHRNLMDVYGVCDQPGNLMVVAEYLPKRLTELAS